MNETTTYYVWPDGTWCTEEDLMEYLTFMSDDYETKELTEEQQLKEDYV